MSLSGANCTTLITHHKKCKYKLEFIENIKHILHQTTSLPSHLSKLTFNLISSAIDADMESKREITTELE